MNTDMVHREPDIPHGTGCTHPLPIIAWAFYDLANQFFALNIVSLYFVRWLVIVHKVPEIFYSLAYAFSVFFVALASPVLGTLADQLRRHHAFLVGFTLLSVFFTMALGWTSHVAVALIFFGLANLGCQLASVFYNALMINLAGRDKLGLISGLGKMFGYSGAALSLWLLKPIVQHAGYQAAFVPTGLLFFLFALPCMLWVKDRPGPVPDRDLRVNRDYVGRIFQTLRQTFFNPLHRRGLFPFFLSVFFSLAAVNVLILFMSVYATVVFGLDEDQMVRLIGFAVFFAIGGSVFFGWLSDRLGAKPTLFLVYLGWMICFISGSLIHQALWYDAVGAGVGLTLGATWVVVRALAVRLVPPESVGEMFGLFHVVGYLSGIVGALYWGGILLLTRPLGTVGSYRLALFSLTFFMLAGMAFLRQIDLQALKKT